MHPLQRLLLLAVLGTMAFGIAGPASAAVPVPPEYTTAQTRISALATQVVDSYRQRSSATDPRYYSDGLWVTGDAGCWTCNVGPAVAAAVMSRNDPSLLPVAIATFDRAILEHQAADGSFVGGDSGPGINDAFFDPQLGTALIVLGDRLDAATKARWTAALVASADYLIRAGHVTWYANGNINLAYAEALYVAWRASGQQRFADAYAAEWQFVLTPPTPRWTGYGLVLTRTPTQADGSDGAGYLTETGSAAPGYDPEYTQVQLDTASSLYVISGDPRALRLMNLLTNQLLPRVSSTYTLDATGGSRHSLMTAFMTPALVLLSRQGRTDLASRLPAQTARIVQEYGTFMAYTHRNYYRGVGSWLAPVLLDGLGAGAVTTAVLPAATAPVAPAARSAAAPASAVAEAPAAAVAVAPATAAPSPTIAVPSQLTRTRVAARGVVAKLTGLPAGTHVSGRLRNAAGRAVGPARAFVTRATTNLTLHLRSSSHGYRRLQVEVVSGAGRDRVTTLSRWIQVA